jgi:hypothetical protein
VQVTIEKEQLIKLGRGNTAYLQFNTLLLSRSDFASCYRVVDGPKPLDLCRRRPT